MWNDANCHIFLSIHNLQIDLPELDNEKSEMMRNFITDLLDNRPGGASFYVIRYTFLKHFCYYNTILFWRVWQNLYYNSELIPWIMI